MNEDTLIDDPSRLELHKRLRFLGRDVFVYGSATAASAAFNLVSFPLLARHFSTADYGVIDFFSVVAMFLTTLVILGQDSAIARFLHDYSESELRRQVASQSLAIQGLVLLATLPIAWLLADPVATRLSDAAESRTLLRLVILQVPFLLLINFAQTILKWTFARGRFVLVSVGSTLASISVLLVGVLQFGVGVPGVFALLLLARAATGLLGLWLVRDWLAMPRDWAIARAMLPFAAPLGVICAIATFSSVLERALIVSFVGQRDLGLYAAGAKIATLIALPVAAFQIAWGPFSLAIHRQADAAQTYNWILRVFTFAILAAVLTLAVLAAPALEIFASNRYEGAAVVVFPLAMAVAVEGIGWITSIGIGFSKRTYLNLVAYLAYVTATAVGVYVLVQAYGLQGAAWGVLTGHLVKSVVETLLAQRVYPLRLSLAPVIVAVACALLVGIGLELVPHFRQATGAR